jgi:ketosteroid isomerase-like protein
VSKGERKQQQDRRWLRKDAMTDHADLTAELVELERAALARWCAGDPSGFLELSAEDVVYFDPYRERRVDGRAALARIYEELRGKIFAERFELQNPLVQRVGDFAVLTFNFTSWSRSGGDAEALRWNCTEVFRRDQAGWRIIQTHWSYTWPPPQGYAG